MAPDPAPLCPHDVMHMIFLLCITQPKKNDPRLTSLDDPRLMSLDDPRLMSLDDPRLMSLDDPRLMSLDDPRLTSLESTHSIEML